MAITLIDVGTTANDGTGDPLRTAFQTVNTALTRLDNTVNVQTGYVLLKDDGGSAGIAVTTAGSAGLGTTAPPHKVSVFEDSDGNRTEIGIDNIDQRLVFGAYFESGVAQYSTIQSTNSAETTAQSLVLQPDGGSVGVNAVPTGNSPLRISGLPTSSAGLSAGEIWNDGGTLKVA